MVNAKLKRMPSKCVAAARVFVAGPNQLTTFYLELFWATTSNFFLEKSLSQIAVLTVETSPLIGLKSETGKHKQRCLPDYQRLVVRVG